MDTLVVDSIDKINLVYFTDVHLADKPPGRRRDNYRETILGKLAFASAIANKINGVGICGGDFFHIKNPKSNSHRLVSDAIESCMSFPQKCIWGVVGNHDILEDNHDSIHNQPLGVLLDAGVYRNLNKSLMIKSKDGSQSVQIVGFDYQDSETTLQAVKDFKLEEADYHVAVIHQMSAPGSGGDFFGEKIIGYNELAGLGYDIVLWGHDHSRIEPTLVGNTRHLHYGSLSRASLSSDEVDRPVIIPVLSFSKDGIKIIEKEVPTDPIEVVFNVGDKIVRSVGKDSEFKDFLADIEDQVSEIESDDPVEIVEALTQDKDVVDLIKDYCEL